jgi:hypothetical protein
LNHLEAAGYPCLKIFLHRFRQTQGLHFETSSTPQSKSLPAYLLLSSHSTFQKLRSEHSAVR